jgi:hypothetical protein
MLCPTFPEITGVNKRLWVTKVFKSIVTTKSTGQLTVLLGEVMCDYQADRTTVDTGGL